MPVINSLDRMTTQIKPCWAIVGVPDHLGVLNVGGRIGAAGGPRAFRTALSRFKHIHPSLVLDQDVAPLSGKIEANHETAAQLVSRAYLQTEGRVVVVGGGHDHGYSHLLGVHRALVEILKKPDVRLGCINLDAHLDVREPKPLVTSGSPFYLAIENKILQPEDFVEFGIQRHCNSKELWDYVSSKKITCVPLRELRNGQAANRFEQELHRLSKVCDAVVISFDLDSVAMAYAPGVSAPQAEGFNPSDIAEMMEIAAREPKSRSLGIFELNPEHDPTGSTALLAASACFHFVAPSLGVAF